MRAVPVPDVRPSVHPVIERAGAYAWRLIVIAIVALGLLWLAGRLLVVVIPTVVALLVARGLGPVASWLRARGLPATLAALLTLMALFAVVGGTLGLAVGSVVSQLDELADTVTTGVDDVETWLVEDSPLDLTPGDLDRARDRLGSALSRFVQSSEGSVASGAAVAAEIATGLLLAVILSFFFLKDGRHLASSVVGALPANRREDARRLSRRGWEALGGYLRGAVLLGAVESVVMAVTLLLVGADLVLPVAMLTFFAAFVPILGAIAAGIVASLVALATAGPVAALVVVAVAVVVQQLDNDLLAPVIYGRALRLHPLVVLVGIAAGGALFGLVGTLLAVPVLAVAWNVTDEALAMSRRSPADDGREDLSVG